VRVSQAPDRAVGAGLGEGGWRESWFAGAVVGERAARAQIRAAGRRLEVNLVGTFNCTHLGAAAIARTAPLDGESVG
jgi:hypothetical protein